MSCSAIHRLLVFGADRNAVAAFVASAVTKEGFLRPITANGSVEEPYRDVHSVTFSAHCYQLPEEAKSMPARLPRRLTDRPFAYAEVLYERRVNVAWGRWLKRTREELKFGGLGASEDFIGFFSAHPELYFYSSILIYEELFAYWEFWKGGHRLRRQQDLAHTFDDQDRFALVAEEWTGGVVVRLEEDEWPW